MPSKTVMTGFVRVSAVTEKEKRETLWGVPERRLGAVRTIALGVEQYARLKKECPEYTGFTLEHVDVDGSETRIL